MTHFGVLGGAETHFCVLDKVEKPLETHFCVPGGAETHFGVLDGVGTHFRVLGGVEAQFRCSWMGRGIGRHISVFWMGQIHISMLLVEGRDRRHISVFLMGQRHISVFLVG